VDKDLSNELKGDGSQVTDLGFLVDANEVSFLGRSGNPLEDWQRLSRLLGLPPSGVDLLDPLHELIPTLVRVHVLDPHVDLLSNDAVSHSLVDDHTQRVLGHIVHASRLAVIKLVGHALLEGAVALDVNHVPAFVHSKVGCQRLHSSLPEVPCKQVPRPSSVTLGVGHLGSSCGFT